MENERKDETTNPEQEEVTEQKPAYTPRPLWQVIGAWVLLVVFVALVVASYVRIFGGAG